MQLASRVDQLSFFQDDNEPEAKERTNSCEGIHHKSSQYEPLDSGVECGAQAAETNSSKSAENSPSLIPVEDDRGAFGPSTLIPSASDKVQQPQRQGAEAAAASMEVSSCSSSSKLLQMIAEPTREQAEEEIGKLTPDELKLFLKLCRDRTVAHKLASDAMTSSTVTSSETSS